MSKALTLPALKVALGSGETLDLATLKGRFVVVYAYPKDSTPGCTREGQDFRDLHPQFVALGAEVFGLSRDSVASHARFAEKQGFPFALISDPDEILCRALDVIQEKSLYGRKFMGIERSTFLFGPDGALMQTWRKVKVPGHAQAVLDALKAAAHG
ncbi:peroxiredoxin [Aquimonas voraii]|uniref:thioredoxin-dependent peroxiredoxin n=1 Tax=Aquimonas voraii TaxID=265719 RepID=A0A1G6XM54_9GAMM|nr:peroxiredoxin [Aquimonas voraii]SDD78407.1 peroxiredoxin Q/BCP [Aquimonas voraii]